MKRYRKQYKIFSKQCKLHVVGGTCWDFEKQYIDRRSNVADLLCALETVWKGIDDDDP